MLKNKFLVLLIWGCDFLLIWQPNLYSQSGIVNNISFYSDSRRDSIYIGYNLSGDSTSVYDVKFCIKDSVYPGFVFVPKVMKGSIGLGKYAGRRNVIVFHKNQLPEDIFESGKIYYDIIATEILKKTDLRNMSLLSKTTESYINEGVAVIIGIDENDKTSYIQNSTKLFSDYCVRVLKIPFEKMRIELNGNASRDAFNAIFRKDGWLHNNITDGLSDVVVYFAGSCAINNDNYGIYLLPSNAKSVEDGIFLSELITNLEGYNPKSVTIFIESFVQNDLGLISYPKYNGDKINILIACRGSQKNYYNDGEKMGLFTYEILKGLSGSSDLNQDKYITLRELYEYTKKSVWDYSVETLGKEQDPILVPDLESTKEYATKILIRLK